MGDLYERLLARVTDTPPPRMKVEDAVQAVLELHKPSTCTRLGGSGYCCPECGHRASACSTVRAIARALDVEIGDTP